MHTSTTLRSDAAEDEAGVIAVAVVMLGSGVLIGGAGAIGAAATVAALEKYPVINCCGC